MSTLAANTLLPPISRWTLVPRGAIHERASRSRSFSVGEANARQHDKPLLSEKNVGKVEARTMERDHETLICYYC